MYTYLKYLIIFWGLLTSADAKTIRFSNLWWEVKEGMSAPGPNQWSSHGVWLDDNGWLHLKIFKQDDKWYCPGIITKKNFSFGKYWFILSGEIDKLDPNVVLGLFNYDYANLNADGTNEIDIEFSKWGSSSYLDHNVSYTVWPAILAANNTSLIYTIDLAGKDSLHGFTWENNKIVFQSGYGNKNDYRQPIMNWVYNPPDFSKRIPQRPLSVHIYLSLVKGMPPTNHKEVEIVIKQFCYLSLDKSTSNCE
ncbi:MAG: hypothetical protein JO149_03250 [Gammaproteobacteria bacterium]|nr:hypothetical protein [Gammaproteobacteria bacterium]